MAAEPCAPAALIAGGLSVAGFVAVLVAQQLILGHWDAWIRTYQKGLPGVAEPLAAFRNVVEPVLTDDLPRRTIAIQALTVLGMLALGLVTSAVKRTWSDPVRAWAALTALLFWAFPLFAGRGVSLYRADALVLPVLLLLVDLPVWMLVPLLAWLSPSPSRWAVVLQRVPGVRIGEATHPSLERALNEARTFVIPGWKRDLSAAVSFLAFWAASTSLIFLLSSSISLLYPPIRAANSSQACLCRGHLGGAATSWMSFSAKALSCSSSTMYLVRAMRLLTYAKRFSGFSAITLS